MQLKQIYIFFVALLWLYSCKPIRDSSVSKETRKNEKKEYSEKDRLSFDYIFHNANKEKIIGNYELAANKQSVHFQINLGYYLQHLRFVE